MHNLEQITEKNLVLTQKVFTENLVEILIFPVSGLLLPTHRELTARTIKKMLNFPVKLLWLMVSQKNCKVFLKQLHKWQLISKGLSVILNSPKKRT